MLKAFAKLFKIAALIIVLLVINPHRAILIPFCYLAVLGSWVAWRLEEGCTWLAQNLLEVSKKMPSFGKGLRETVDKDLGGVKDMVREYEDKLKEFRNGKA